MGQTETRNVKLDLRLTPSAKRTLQIAAQGARRSVSLLKDIRAGLNL